MSKGKRFYCTASFLFACAVLIFTLFTYMGKPIEAYASNVDTSDVSDMDTSGLTDVKNPDSSEEEDNSGRDIVDGLSITYNNDSGSATTTIRMFLVLTILSLAPSLLIMLTSFTRIIIVLHFVRTAIGTQSSPPNQVLIGLALFLTFFIMWPTFEKINTTAIQPFEAGEITQEEAFEAAEIPLREFMYGETQEKDLKVFVDISGETYESYDDIPFTTLVPAFILSELRTAFIMGFLIYIPFIVIDMVVSSVLLSMGMMMLPPTTISLPFKILLFILADGWSLIVESVVQTFM